MKQKRSVKDKLLHGYVYLVLGCVGIAMVSMPVYFLKLHVPRWQAALADDQKAEESVSDADGQVHEQDVPIDWQAQYPFRDAEAETVQTDERQAGSVQRLVERYEGLVSHLEEKIDYYCTEGLFFYTPAVSVAAKGEHLAGNWVMNNDLLQMENGYLTYKEDLMGDSDIRSLADEVADFRDFLEAQGIEFLYANAGSKVCPYDKQLNAVDVQKEHTNENGTALLSALTERGVEVLDFREAMQQDGLDWYDSYYKTDHHWKTETGLWAAGKLAERLNETGKFSFDPSVFAAEHYNFETEDDFFLGGQGKMATFANAELESYTRITPKYQTDFSLQIPTRDLDIQGDYAYALYDGEAFDEIFSYDEQKHLNAQGAYDCIRARNDAVALIRNQMPTHNQGKKILMLQDSFSWYLTSFLACDIEQVDAVHLMGFSGSIRSYIEQNRPDAVVLIYCEKNISPIDRSTHGSAFDLR